MPYSPPSPQKRNFTHCVPNKGGRRGARRGDAAVLEGAIRRLIWRYVQRRGVDVRPQYFASMRSMKLRGSPYQNPTLGVSCDR
jgi:hypothetical protein